MSSRKPSILHVLPYPGGGGETYVNRLVSTGTFRFEKTYVARGPTHRPAALLVGGIRAQLATRRWDLLHVQGEVAAGLCQPALALRPSVLTINGLHLVRRQGGSRRALAVANLRLIVRAASRTICVGDAEFSEVESLVGTSERLVLVRNGVDLPPSTKPEERAAARTALGLSPSVTVGLYLAALDPHKEPLIVARAALEAARRQVPVVLLFAGEGPLREELESLSGDNHVLRVLGFQSEVHRLFAASDFFVLPSRREGLSFALLEAMSHGLAPVVSDAPGNPEAVGDAGIVVPYGDLDGFRTAFERLALDQVERKRMEERARARVIERFSSAQMVEGTRAVYDQVLGTRKGSIG